jgi:hypothetical protein
MNKIVLVCNFNSPKEIFDFFVIENVAVTSINALRIVILDYSMYGTVKCNYKF